MGKDILTKEMIYRDTKTYYAKAERKIIGKEHLKFCKQYAGKRILDFGCATGDYCLELLKSDFNCVGVDINGEYVNIARQKGVEAYLVTDKLPFANKSFDSVIMIEVLEHVKNIDEVLKEVKRIACKNILVTVPNCDNYMTLQGHGLTYAHFLELDHTNFFTKHSLRKLLKTHFDRFEVFERGPIDPYTLLPRPFLYYSLGILCKLGIVKPAYYSCLFAVIDIKV